jgi:hypothetical protein
VELRTIGIRPSVLFIVTPVNLTDGALDVPEKFITSSCVFTFPGTTTPALSIVAVPAALAEGIPKPMGARERDIPKTPATS